MERCPRCGTRADAVPVTHHVPPGKARRIAEHLEVVRRELGLPSDGEALAAAVRLVALDLNQGRRIGSADAGHTARAIRPRRKDVGEHEHEEQPAEGTQQDDGGATPGSTGEAGAAPVEGGDESVADPVHPPEGDGADEAEATDAEAETDGEPEGEPEPEPQA